MRLGYCSEPDFLAHPSSTRAVKEAKILLEKSGHKMVEFTMNHKSFRKEEDRRPLPLVPCAKFSLGTIFYTSRKWFNTLLASGYFSFQKALGKFDSVNFLALVDLDTL